jgi:hypothetical protein
MFWIVIICTLVEMKSKFHHITCHEGTVGVEVLMYLYLTSALCGGWLVKAMPRPLHSCERHAVLILQKAGWVSGPLWTAVEDFVTPVGLLCILETFE